MSYVNFDDVIQSLSEQIGNLVRDNAVLKSVAHRQAAEIERLKAALSIATQESKETA